MKYLDTAEHLYTTPLQLHHPTLDPGEKVLVSGQVQQTRGTVSLKKQTVCPEEQSVQKNSPTRGDERASDAGEGPEGVSGFGVAPSSSSVLPPPPDHHRDWSLRQGLDDVPGLEARHILEAGALDLE